MGEAVLVYPLGNNTGGYRMIAPGGQMYQVQTGGAGCDRVEEHRNKGPLNWGPLLDHL